MRNLVAEPLAVQPGSEPPGLQPGSEPPGLQPGSEPPGLQAVSEPPWLQPVSEPPALQPGLQLLTPLPASSAGAFCGLRGRTHQVMSQADTSNAALTG